MFSVLAPILVSIFVFFVYVYWREREGLQNHTSPVSLLPDQTTGFNFYKKLTTESDPLYNKKFEYYYNADIKADLSYFNNTSSLLYALSKLEKPETK
jgi:hypothetical protein